MRLKTFSPSMYKEFKKCAKKVQYSHIEHLCSLCFKGEMRKDAQGKFTCTTCGQYEIKAAPLQRGIDYDEAITGLIQSGSQVSPLPMHALPPITNQAALRAIGALQVAHPSGQIKTQERIWLDAEWNLSPETGRSVTLVLDVLILDEEAGYAQVLDWKTGSLTKTGKLRSNALEGYIDQLETYALGVLAKYPKVNHVDTACYFLDANVGRSDSLSYGRGENYQHVKERWTRILRNTLSTEKFDPSPGWWCPGCPYTKAAGGPCAF